MAKYGYVRVSSKDQNIDRQTDALLECGLQKSNIFVDHMSGKDFERPAYKKLLTKVKSGDAIVIKSIDRLGRNYNDILDQWRYITKEKEVDIKVLDMPLLNTGMEESGLTGMLISDLILEILAYVAETERAFIWQRQREGIESAKRRGVKFGRSKAEIPDDFEIIYSQYMKGEHTIRSAAQLSGLSPSTFYRRCRERVMQDEDKDSCSKG